MKKLNQRYINKIIFSKLFENEKPIPELGYYNDPLYLEPRPRPTIPADLDPGILWALDQQEREQNAIEDTYYFLNDYYRQFKEWYEREYPDDNDPGRLQRAWEAMQREIQRLINHGYTVHEIRKYYYIHTDGKHNRSYEDFPDWYHQSNEQVYGHNKRDWIYPIRRNGQVWR
jgi:hypothetical protein